MGSLRALVAVVGAWGGERETWLRYLGLGLIMLLVRRVIMVRVGGCEGGESEDDEELGDAGSVEDVKVGNDELSCECGMECMVGI